MAEIEIGMAQRQCLNRRLAKQATVEKELLNRADTPNVANATTALQFTLPTPYQTQATLPNNFTGMNH